VSISTESWSGAVMSQSLSQDLGLRTRTWSPRTRTSTRNCKLVIEDPWRQGLTSRTTLGL